MTKTVPEILRDAAETYEIRNTIYGGTYLLHGKVGEALFPNGVSLVTQEDHVRFGLMTMLIGKLTRYSQNFATGGHADSIHDLVVYAAMLEEVDSAIAAEKAPKPFRPFSPKPAPVVGDSPAVSSGNGGTEKRPTPVPEDVSIRLEPEPDGRELTDDQLAAILAEEPADGEPPVVIPEPPVQK